jgi:hypothetical protein
VVSLGSGHVRRMSSEKDRQLSRYGYPYGIFRFVFLPFEGVESVWYFQLLVMQREFIGAGY